MFTEPILFNGALQQGFAGGDPERVVGGGTQYLSISDSTRKDRVQLDPAVRGIHPFANDHLLRCELRPATQLVWTQDPVAMRSGEQYVPCMFNSRLAPTNATSSEYAQWARVTEELSSKEGFVDFARRDGLSGLLPPTVGASARDAGTLQVPFQGPWWVKNAEGETTGGVNVRFCENVEQRAAAIAEFVELGVAVQVQADVPGEDISNQYLAIGQPDGSARLVFLGTTNQVVRGGHHAGNQWPASVGDCGWLTHAFAQAVVRLGLRGFFGVDARIHGLSGWVTEWNLRVNGSSVPLYLAHSLGYDSVYLIRETPVNPTLSPEQVFKRLEESGYEHKRGKGGVIAYLWGWLESNHTLGIAAFGDNAEWQYDRVASMLIA